MGYVKYSSTVVELWAYRLPWATLARLVVGYRDEGRVDAVTNRTDGTLSP